ncbi:hypothetical protein BDU57DRAFT_247683 [Ampelomyces quisqualis]|uniref:Uncharacterized protein n=1 Tax=Ampelomyces quisqualis TaxID=50730 RepID=A0A6A5QN56_AMPQU|nr:hypothetical protein BDU57DRAFT_247683 [Ampelomyces quisqualis]
MPRYPHASQADISMTTRSSPLSRNCSSTSSVKHVDLRIMNGALPRHGNSNFPYAFNPGANASVATDTNIPSVPATSATKDRLVVGVDFGKIYIGE